MFISVILARLLLHFSHLIDLNPSSQGQIGHGMMADSSGSIIFEQDSTIAGSADKRARRSYNFPDEVLSAILLIVHWETTAHFYRYTPIEVTASRVSKHWHRTALNTSMLWTAIHIGPHAIRTSDQLDCYLSRSHSYPLFINIELYYKKNTATSPLHLQYEALVVCARLFARATKRIIGLRLLTVGPPAIMQSLLAVMPTAAPCLQALYIVSQPAWHGDAIHLFSGGAPCLTNIGLKGIGLDQCNPPLARVTELQWEDGLLPRQDRSEFLTSMPALAVLRTIGCVALLQRAPKVLTIVVDKDCDPGHLEQLLDIIASFGPNAVLTLKNVQASHLPMLVYHVRAAALLRRTRVLELHNCDISEDSAMIVPFLLALREVRLLGFASKADGAFMRCITWQIGGALVLPELKVIAISAALEMKIDDVLSLINERAQAGVPLDSIRFARRRDISYSVNEGTWRGEPLHGVAVEFEIIDG